MSITSGHSFPLLTTRFKKQLYSSCSFERELKNKLAQKASGAQSEETVLLKSFKYFDLNNNGTVEPEEFAKAIEKIGIMIPTRQVRKKIQIGVWRRRYFELKIKDLL